MTGNPKRSVEDPLTVAELRRLRRNSATPYWSPRRN